MMRCVKARPMVDIAVPIMCELASSLTKRTKLALTSLAS
ncbi:Uncharacterised protein [Vibrio cholerae]|nr:Uncharacterised protein [Vibrio cholerae]CSB61426.1 Uncharacterised protein [Vibrio cholerae]CSH88614.1 Uncharacterised protein [Vibrio cholerae]